MFYLVPKPQRMKFLLALVLSLSFIYSNGQDCGSHALMKKGKQLEYMVYNPEYRDGKALRMVYEVADVTDSGG